MQRYKCDNQHTCTYMVFKLTDFTFLASSQLTIEFIHPAIVLSLFLLPFVFGIVCRLFEGK